MQEEKELDLQDTTPDGCGECAYYQDGCCREIKGKLSIAKPYFMCSRDKFHVPCKYFKLKTSRRYVVEKPFLDMYKDHTSLHGMRREVAFELSRDPCVWYYVPIKEFVSGDPIEGGRLKAIRKEYFKRSASAPCGLELVKEQIDGVAIG